MDAVRSNLMAMRAWYKGETLVCDCCDRLYRYCRVPLPLSEASGPFWVGDWLSHRDFRPHALMLVVRDAASAAEAWSAGVPLKDAVQWMSSWEKGSGFILHKCLWLQQNGLGVPDFLHFDDEGICQEIQRRALIHHRQVKWVRRVFQNGGGCVLCNRRYATTRCGAKAPGQLPLHFVSRKPDLCEVCAYVCDCADGTAWCPACVTFTTESKLASCACGQRLCFRCNKGLTEPQCWSCFLKT